MMNLGTAIACMALTFFLGTMFGWYARHKR